MLTHETHEGTGPGSDEVGIDEQTSVFVGAMEAEQLDIDGAPPSESTGDLLVIRLSFGDESSYSAFRRRIDEDEFHLRIEVAPMVEQTDEPAVGPPPIAARQVGEHEIDGKCLPRFAEPELPHLRRVARIDIVRFEDAFAQSEWMEQFTLGWCGLREPGMLQNPKNLGVS
jgi:hypothetical protein